MKPQVAVAALGARGKMENHVARAALVFDSKGNIGALANRIGFWGPVYYNCKKEPPK